MASRTTNNEVAMTRKIPLAKLLQEMALVRRNLCTQKV